MKIQQLIEEQMKEFDKEFYLFGEDRDYTITFTDGKGFKGGNSASNLGKRLKSFINAYTRKIIETAGEEVISTDRLHGDRLLSTFVECTQLRLKQDAKLKEIISSLK